MTTLLMCKPEYYDVTYEINPWMPGNVHKVDKALALDQWFNLYESLQSKVLVRLIPQAPGCPDMVFTANAGYVQYNKVALSYFMTKERAPEEEIWRKWFCENGYTAINQTVYPFEGAGDFLTGPGGYPHYFGNGFRSLSAAGMLLNALESRLSWFPVQLTDPRFYHLDTCFCPLDSNTILCYPPALNGNDLSRATRGMDLITVSEDEAVQFACNAVVIGKDVYMPKCYSVADKLSKKGFEPHLFEMSEFIKAGGACKCLTLEI